MPCFHVHKRTEFVTYEIQGIINVVVKSSQHSTHLCYATNDLPAFLSINLYKYANTMLNQDSHVFVPIA